MLFFDREQFSVNFSFFIVATVLSLGKKVLKICELKPVSDKEKVDSYS